MTNIKTWQKSHYLILLTFIWFCGLGLLLVLQLTTNTNIGLRMPMIGEDRYWYWHLLRPSIAGISSSHSFWQIENRNPLSPVWYTIVGPLIIQYPEYAFHIIRRSIDLLTAISIFLLVDTLGRKSHRLFAFSCALLTLYWNTFGINVSWNIIGQTALHLLSIWLYCLYLDSDRRKGSLLVLSIFIYFFAIGTYLLVAFSFLAIGGLALFRPLPPAKTVRGWANRVLRSVTDMSFYAAALAIFIILWQTTSTFPTFDNFLNFSLIQSQLPSSLDATFIQPLLTIPIFINRYFAEVSLTSGVAILIVAFIFFTVVLWLTKHFSEPMPTTTNIAPVSTTLYYTIAFTLLVMISLAAYITILESVSTTWGPGTRSFIIKQAILPLTYVSLIFGLSNLLHQRFRSIVTWMRIGAVALLCTLTLLSSLGFDQQLISIGNREDTFITKLVHDIPPNSLKNKPTEIMAILTPSVSADDFVVNFTKQSNFSHTYYIQSAYHRGDIGFHLFSKGEMPAKDVQPDIGYNEYTFGPDPQGVRMGTYLSAFLFPNGFYDAAWIPYQNILFVKYDGQTWTQVDEISPQDLAGYKVHFERDTPIHSLY